MTPADGKVSILYFNARSLLTKKSELQIISTANKPCVLACKCLNYKNDVFQDD